MDIRRATADDLPAIERTWREVGWLEDDDTSHFASWFQDATAWVGGPGDEPECVVTTHDGRMAVMGEDLPLGPVTSVTTSRVARRLGLAGRLLTRALLHVADAGAALSALGMFEQGFYDRFGYGNGAPTLGATFDPARLRVPVPSRSPVRLGRDDWEELAALDARRPPTHGRVAIDVPSMFRGELGWCDPWIGLGFRNDEGTLTHALWGDGKGEHGPLGIEGMAWDEPDGLMELLGLIRSLGDQYRVATMHVPAEVVLTDVLDQPGRASFQTRGAKHHLMVQSQNWWQVRVLDVPQLVAARPWEGPPVSFTVELTDPLADHAEAAGLGRFDRVEGAWVITLGEESNARRGSDDALPALHAGVGAFTRALLGVAPASTLARTDDLAAPADLLADLDRVLLAPAPHPGRYF